MKRLNSMNLTEKGKSSKIKLLRNRQESLVYLVYPKASTKAYITTPNIALVTINSTLISSSVFLWLK